MASSSDRSQLPRCGGCLGIIGSLKKCSGCSEALYCCESCQRGDWKRHRLVCRSQQHWHERSEMVRDLVRMEMEWLVNLPDEHKSLLQQMYDEETFVFNHYMYSLTVGLVLAGVNACHYHFVDEQRFWSEYGLEFSENVLYPWYQKHQDRLQEGKFRLKWIRRALRYCLCAEPCHEKDCAHPVEAQEAPVFWNENHPKAALVKRCFLPSEPTALQSFGPTVDLDWKEWLECIGSPASCRIPRIMFDRRAEPSSSNFILFEVRHPEELFGRHACCSDALTCYVLERDAEAAGAYFRTCRLALKKLGVSILFQTPGADAAWEVESLAKLTIAASGNNESTARMYEREGIIFHGEWGTGDEAEAKRQRYLRAVREHFNVEVVE